MKFLAIGSAVLVLIKMCPAKAQNTNAPVRYAIMGLTHDHASGFLARQRDRRDVQLVGIVEARADLVARYAARFPLATNLFAPSLDELLRRTNVDAVATFTSTFEHRAVVEKCSAKGIH